MQDNVNRILERGDRLENIDQRTEVYESFYTHLHNYYFRHFMRRLEF